MKQRPLDPKRICGTEYNAFRSEALITVPARRLQVRYTVRIPAAANTHTHTCKSLNRPNRHPLQFTASPVSIPIRSYAFQRPMRSSVEGLNQEIEKLVLIPGQPHTCRPESSHVRVVGLPTKCFSSEWSSDSFQRNAPLSHLFSFTVCTWFTWRLPSTARRYSAQWYSLCEYANAKQRPTFVRWAA